MIYITDLKIIKIINIFVKILLLLIISTFFMPFLSVSCDMLNTEIRVSGIEMATVIRDFNQAGNPAAFILIIPTVLLFVISFIRLSAAAHAIFYITVSVINTVIAFGIKLLIEIELYNRLSANQFGEAFPFHDALKINIKTGFVLYIIFNIVLLFTGIALLIIFFHKTISEIRKTEID